MEIVSVLRDFNINALKTPSYCSLIPLPALPNFKTSFKEANPFNGPISFSKNPVFLKESKTFLSNKCIHGVQTRYFSVQNSSDKPGSENESPKEDPNFKDKFQRLREAAEKNLEERNEERKAELKMKNEELLKSKGALRISRLTTPI